jgi:hypothetical protein
MLVCISIHDFLEIHLPRGASAPGRNSALMDNFETETRDEDDAGRKATADTAREATRRVWNILI